MTFADIVVSDAGVWGVLLLILLLLFLALGIAWFVRHF